MSSNLKTNGWNTILCVGNFPNDFYKKIRHISYAFVVMNLNDPEDYYVEDAVPYHSNIIVISCKDFGEYEELMKKLINSPYWHPLANVIVYYHKIEDRQLMAKIFFSLWYHKAINAILVQYNDVQKSLIVSDYTPYVNEHYYVQPDNKFGCWTARNLGMPVRGFEEDLICVEKCHNITVTSKLRTNHLGTCLGFNTNALPYNAINDLRKLKLFEDRTKSLHGYAFTGYITEIKPFSVIEDLGNGTYKLRARDGMIWTTMAELMNFTIDLSLSLKVMKKPFNFEVNIEQIFAFARRRGDLCLFPIYQFDVIVVELDFTFPFKDSGICIVAARAGFETSLFQVKNLKPSLEYLSRFVVCFLCIWATFTIYKTVENGRLTFDQIGKDFMNACRNVLMLNLHKPPRYESFRIFLTVSLWSFFVINFTTQATIVSFFTAAKRGKEVNTFDDVIEKGYPIEAMASPDLILPDTEEKFITFNSRLVYEQDIYGCITRMASNTRRFCLIDCSVGRYIKRNKLNEKGEQFLHIAEGDRIHSHYLTMVLTKNSPFTERYNRYMMMIFEAGLIRKWEQYRYTDIKDEVTTKPLKIDDLSGIFEAYCFCVASTMAIFLLELVIHRLKMGWKNCLKSRKCRRLRVDEQYAFWKRKPKQNTE